MAKAKNKTVFVGMSGGVDSSVAAALLKREGYTVVGVHLRCFNVDGCAEGDAEDARRVAEHLHIPFYVFDFERDYKKRVVEYMIEGYRAGITPNPDVMCNREIKFGLFFERAVKLGADYVATGHYVKLRRFSLSRTGGSLAPAASDRLRSRPDGSRRAAEDQARRGSESFSQKEIGSFGLFEAKDKNKDQSYFLWTLTQEQLRHSLFPIGDYLKFEVRAIARKLGLPTAEKKDSQGICFLGKVSIKDFLKKYIKEKPGIILTTQGKKVGEHKGIYFYTIGQRHLGVKYQVSSSKYKGEAHNDQEPFYVAEKNIKTNTLVVAHDGDDALFRRELTLSGVHVINPLILNTKYKIPVMARIRYRQPLAKATLLQISHSNPPAGGPNYKLIFDSPQKFVAEGQSAVFYTKKGEMLGGGVIV